MTYKNSPEIWSPRSPEFVMDNSILQAVKDINRQDPKDLIDKLKQKVQSSENGIKFAVLDGENPIEYSSSDALVMFNPFANAATPNMLVRAEFVRLVAKNEDIRDEEGRLKPIVMLASPGLNGSKISLSKNEIEVVRGGELGPVAKQMLHAVAEIKLGRVSLLGFSQGADIAIAGTKKAYDANLDIHSVAVGEPAGIMDRTVVELGSDFIKSGGLKDVVETNKIEVQKSALGFGYGGEDLFLRFIPSTIISRTNYYIWQALGEDSFERNIQIILSEGKVKKLILGYGSESAITKPQKIEQFLSTIEGSGQTSISAIKVEGAKHNWGDNLALLAKLYMRIAN